MWSGCIFERNIITHENTSTCYLHGAIKSIAHGRIFESPSEVAHVCTCKSVCNSVRWKYTTFAYYVHGGLHPQSIFQSFERKGKSLIKFLGNAKNLITCAWVNKWIQSLMTEYISCDSSTAIWTGLDYITRQYGQLHRPVQLKITLTQREDGAAHFSKRLLIKR